MNAFVLICFCLFIASIHAQFNITRQIPNNTILSTTHQFIFQIDSQVNQPQFQSFIHFYNAITNTSFYQIDVSNSTNSTNNVTYSNHTLTFLTPNSVQFNISDEFYITFDQGVLFSNNVSNSTSELDRQFWYLKVIGNTTTSLDTTTSGTSMAASTLTGTSYSGTTGSSMANNNISTFIMTTIVSTYTSMNQNTTVIIPTTTINGDTSPTRSAQLGMGLGITFITVIIIGEIIYFKFCYSGSRRSGSYFT